MMSDGRHGRGNRGSAAQGEAGERGEDGACRVARDTVKHLVFHVGATARP